MFSKFKDYVSAKWEWLWSLTTIDERAEEFINELRSKRSKK